MYIYLSTYIVSATVTAPNTAAARAAASNTKKYNN